MSDTIARKLKIHGRVQGVWYRESMRCEAERCGIRGWVRNCLDGTVEAYIEGEPGAVEQIQAWCRRGPPSAGVTEIHSEEAGPDESIGFRVLPSE